MSLGLYLFRDGALENIRSGGRTSLVAVFAHTPREATELVELGLGNSSFTDFTRISMTAGTFTYASLSIAETGLFADYTYASGDYFYVTSGTASGTDTLTAGAIAVASRTDDDTIVLASSPFSGTDNGTAMVGYLLNVQRIDWTDATNLLTVLPVDGSNELGVTLGRGMAVPVDVPGLAFEIKLSAA